MRPIPAEQGGDLYLVQGAQIKLEDAGKNFVPTGTAGESKPDEGDDKPKTKKDKTQ